MDPSSLTSTSTDHTLSYQIVHHVTPDKTNNQSPVSYNTQSKSNPKSLSLSKQRNRKYQCPRQETDGLSFISSTPNNTSTCIMSAGKSNYTHNNPVQNLPNVSAVPPERPSPSSTKSPPLNDTSYFCNICSKHFGHRCSLHKHTKSCHPEQLNQGKIKCQEYGCNFTSKVLSQLRQHLQSKHAMKLDMEDKLFSNYDGKIFIHILLLHVNFVSCHNTVRIYIHTL